MPVTAGRAHPYPCFLKFRLIFGLASMLCIPAAIHAQESPRTFNFKVNATAGYSTENLDWSIRGKNANGEPVDILSELQWKKLRGPYLYLNGEWPAWKDFFVRSEVSKTFITSGRVSDTDFGKNNRRDTLFHDVFNSDKGGDIRYSAALGYRLHLMDKHTISPFAGYGNDSQSLYMLRDNGNVQGDLRSTYRTKWNGLLAGVDIKVCLHKKMTATGQITYHQVNYSAKADWNLIEDFKHPVSFSHQAKGYGLVTVAGLEYATTKSLFIMLTAGHGYWTTGTGADTLYRTNGDIVVTPLNPVRRNNLTFSAGIQMTFN